MCVNIIKVKVVNSIMLFLIIFACSKLRVIIYYHTDMFDIKNIDSWRKDFGLFPLSIMPTNTGKYALLNGGNKDFCIDLNPIDDNTGVFNSYAWSANTKNYLAVSNDNVIIYNWLRSNIETLRISDVQNNIEAFYSYLGKYTYNTGH